MRFKIFLFSNLFLLLSFSFFAQEERITDFDIKIEVNKDRSILVTEEIEVIVTGDIIKRGITRSLPKKRTMGDRNVNMRYDIIGIERDGNKEKYKTESNERFKVIYVGEKEVFLRPGKYRYKITYRVPDQIEFFENYDEIYWNAIGTDVIFPIEKARCRVILPLEAEVLQAAAYVGAYGQSAQDYSEQKIEDGLMFETTRALSPYEGFTIGVGFEKGVIEPVKFMGQFGTILILILGSIILFPYYIVTWMRHGQDPPSPPSYPQWDSPDDLSPAALNYILKENYQTKSYTASVIDLAIKGFLRIEEQQTGLKIFKSKKFNLIKLREPDPSLSLEEENLFNQLFSGRSIAKIDGKYRKYIESSFKNHKSGLQRQFRSFINKGRNYKYLAFPILLSVAIIVISFIVFSITPYASEHGITYATIFALAAFLSAFIFGYLINKPTPEKLELQSRIRGFKMYLEMAEKERLRLLNPPNMTPEHFEKMLPYALALGVEHKWSEKFEKILEAAQYRPDWHNSANSIYFYNNLNSGFTRSVTGSATKPSSSGGSGGGGFSGGGGGGGGVGGW